MLTCSCTHTCCHVYHTRFYVYVNAFLLFQLLAKLKEKGPPKTLACNLPKRETGEQTPFGRERPKLLHTPDAIAMRQAIEAEVCVALGACGGVVVDDSARA